MTVNSTYGKLRQKMTSLENQIIILKQNEKYLLQKQKKYKSLINHAPVGIYEVDFIKNRFISVNDVMCQYTGYSRDEMIGLSLWEILAGESRSVYRQRKEEMLSGKAVSESVEYLVKKKDGSTFWVMLTGSLVYKNGKPSGATVFVHDIDARKQAEIALKKSEAKYRSHFEKLSEIIFSMDSQFKFLTVSPAVERELGYQPEELIGKSFVDSNLLEPASLEAALKDARRTFAGERLPPSEFQFITKNGTRKWIEVSSARIVPRNEDISVVCVARDISARKEAEKALQRARDELEERVAVRTAELIKTNQDLLTEVAERRLAEKALKESELKYRTVFDYSSDGICLYESLPDSEIKKLVDCNESYVRMSGRKKHELLSAQDVGQYQKDINDKNIEGTIHNRGDTDSIDRGTFTWIRPERKNTLNSSSISLHEALLL